MNSEDMFWTLCWKMVTIFACACTVTVGSCTAYESTLVERMVSHGADPLRAKCAMNMDARVCFVMSGQKER